MFEDTLLAFIPVFVAIDAIGSLPIFVSLTDGMDDQVKRKTIIQSLWTAMGLAVGFIFLGKIIFSMLGITFGDFMIAGGGILFCIAIMDLLVPTDKKRRMPSEDLGVVPLGTPLIVGPAVLTTSLLLIDQYGLYPTLVAVLLNIIIAGVVFSCSGRIIRTIGKSGSRALSKVMALLLAAIAVKMVRMGVFAILP